MKKKQTFDERMKAQKEASAGANAWIRSRGKNTLTTVDRGGADKPVAKFFGDFIRRGAGKLPAPETKPVNRTSNTKLKMTIKTLPDEDLVFMLKTVGGNDPVRPYIEREARIRQAAIDKEAADE